MKILNKINKWIRKPQYKWLRISDIYLFHAFEKISLDKNREHYNFNTIEKIMRRLEKLKNLQWKISIFNVVLLIVLIMTIYDLQINFTVSGMRLDKLDNIREIILLISTFIGVYASVLAVISYTIERFIEKFIAENVPEKYKNLYEMMYYSHISLFAKVITPYWKSIDRFITGNRIIVFSPLLLIFMILLFLIIYTVIFTTVHIIVIIDIWNDPSLPFWMNRFIVFITLCSDVFMLLCIFLIAIPVRYLDLETLTKIDAAKKISETAYYQALSEVFGKTVKK